MKTRPVIAGAALALVCSVASAGLYQPVPVQIDFTNRTASGDMLTARDSVNPNEFIGCGVRYSSAGLVYAFCQAGIGPDEGQYFTCYTFNPALVDAIKSIGDFSYITFRWNEDGECTYIGNSTQSFYVPDLKSKAK